MPHSGRQSLAKKAGGCVKTCTDQPFCYDYIHKHKEMRGLMKLVHKEKDKRAGFKLTYETEVQDRTYRQCLIEWAQKEETWQRKRQRA